MMNLTFTLIRQRYITKKCVIFKNVQKYAAFSSANSENNGAQRQDPEMDIETLFLNPHTQTLLKRITGLDLHKVYAPKKEIPKPLPQVFDFFHDYLFQKKEKKPPVYKFMTEKEYNKLIEQFKQRAINEKLQMPPVMKARKPIDEFITRDPELEGYSQSKFIFTDITYTVRENDKVILVREPDGTLRRANWDERDRMNRIYNPLPGRTVTPPSMFKPEHLERVLNEEHYVFVLSRACLQYNPDDPEYIRVVKRTYDHIDQRGKYNSLRSTRFFGPMAFYLATESSIDGLLIDMLERELVNDTGDLITLYNMAHHDYQPQGNEREEWLRLLKSYIHDHSTQKARIDLALQKYQELEKQRQLHQQHVAQAHGQ